MFGAVLRLLVPRFHLGPQLFRLVVSAFSMGHNLQNRMELAETSSFEVQLGLKPMYEGKHPSWRAEIFDLVKRHLAWSEAALWSCWYRQPEEGFAASLACASCLSGVIRRRTCLDNYY